MKIYRLKWAFTPTDPHDLTMAAVHYATLEAALRDLATLQNHPNLFGADLSELSDDGFGRLTEVSPIRHIGQNF